MVVWILVNSGNGGAYGFSVTKRDTDGLCSSHTYYGVITLARGQGLGPILCRNPLHWLYPGTGLET